MCRLTLAGDSPPYASTELNLTASPESAICQVESNRVRAPARRHATVSGEFFVVRADVGEGAVLHAEAVRNSSKLGEAKALVKMPHVYIAFDDRTTSPSADAVYMLGDVSMTSTP